MSLEIKRLHLARLRGPDGGEWPVHGFVVTHPGGAVLVDTGVGGPERLLTDWRVVNTSAADALAELDMTPADIGLVINTHLHFDHCGQNAVFRHAACHVQRAELDRAKRESPDLYDWFDFMNARFEVDQPRPGALLSPRQRHSCLTRPGRLPPARGVTGPRSWPRRRSRRTPARLRSGHARPG